MRTRLFIASLFLTFFAVLNTSAQTNFKLAGTIIDNQSKEGIDYATVRLLRPDSTMVTGTNTDEGGEFLIEAPVTPGKYIVRLSYIGYRSIFKDIEIAEEQDSLNMGKLTMYSDDYVLKAAVVMASASKVTQVGDTTVFNADAYRVPEGSTLEALVKQLPGVNVSDDGTITFNGKTVTEFLVNGKDYFKGDTQVAMKNLPTNLVKKIKAYDKKSDYAEMTGIDDGEESTVLDITTKRELNESWVSNVDVAYGTHNRYSGKIFVTRFADNSHITAYGSINNTGDQGFGSQRGFGGGGGVTTKKDAGLDLSWENGKARNTAGRFETGLSANYGHTTTHTDSRTATETFLTQSSNKSFSNSNSHSYSSSTNVNLNGRIMWNPDSLSFIMFRPSYTFSNRNNYSRNRSCQFNEDPYDPDSWSDEHATDSEKELAKANMDAIESSLRQGIINEQLLPIVVNTNLRNTFGFSQSHSVNGFMMGIRRFGSSKGSNINFNVRAGYTHNDNTNFSFSNMRYYNTGTGKSSPQAQYSVNPSTSWNISSRVGYAQKLVGNWFAEARYEYSHKYQSSDRTLRNITEADTTYILDDTEASRTWHRISNIYDYTRLSDADIEQWVKDLYNSQQASYKYNDQTVSLGIRYNSSTIRFNAGLDFKPQRTTMDYNNLHVDTLITRKVFNWAPSARLRYKFNNTTNLDFNYRGSTSQPSMTDLLETIDDSNQNSVSMGNANLLPSWSHTFRGNFTTYNAERQAGMNAGIDGGFTRDDVSSLRIYDTRTGNSYSQRQNINGNWNASGRFMYNTGMGRSKLWTFMTNTSLSYRNYVSFVGDQLTSEGEALLDAAINSRKISDYAKVFKSVEQTTSTTRSTNISEGIKLGFRQSLWDINAVGNLSYQHSRNDLQKNANMDTWNFNYGLEGNLTLDCGVAFSTDIRMQSRRGYASKEMNTNELLWNAQASYSFLKGKPLTISVQYYDILHQQSNISRTISALQRSDSWTNGVHSYLMVHVVYKLNIFGGKRSKGDDDDNSNRGNRNGMNGGFGGGMMAPPSGGMGGMGGGPR